MKEISKKIWFSKMTIGITIVQLIISILGGFPFFRISGLMLIIINILAMVVINCSIKWMDDKGRNDVADVYWKNAPCMFQAIKFSIGIILSMAIVLINLVHKIEGINIEKIIFTWYFLPLLLTFVAIAFMDIGLYDNISIKQKIIKLPLFPKKFCLCMFDYSKDGKINVTIKGVLSTIALMVLAITVVVYFIFNLF